LAQAAAAWQRDTGIVSNFLNTATSLTGTAFTRAASTALAAENDELTHKAVIDAAVPKTQSLRAANNALATQGNFQNVVDLLQDMVNRGAKTAVTDTNQIDQGRCAKVLPNIDIYLAAAGTDLQAVRPDACSQTAQV
ncbi:hypothetical protein K461DRAFT_204348, partial [Myriangium duriaei CBS 260.36]